MLLPADPARAFMPYPPAEVPHAPSGALGGMTLGVKDLLDVAGYPTSAGSPHVLAMSGEKTRTAPIVKRLLDAGARFVGKTITDELAFSLNGKNAHFGTPRNGGAPDRIPGGSSSGSASAVSNGLCDIGLGTDTGGSVRAPANHCGLFGLRPTHGRVSLEGAYDLAPSFDTCGFFAKDRTVFVRVGEVLLGDDPAPISPAPRLLLAADAFGLLDRALVEALEPAVKRAEAALGAAGVVEIAQEGFGHLAWAFRYLQGREAWVTHGPMIERYAPPLGPGVAERFAFARVVTDAQVEQGRQVRAMLRERLGRALGADGVIMLPTMPDVAPLLTEGEAALEGYRNNAINLLCIAGLTGLPQVSMPLASRLGAPLGLSLIGPAGSDRSLVRLAERIAAGA